MEQEPDSRGQQDAEEHGGAGTEIEYRCERARCGDAGRTGLRVPEAGARHEPGQGLLIRAGAREHPSEVARGRGLAAAARA